MELRVTSFYGKATVLWDEGSVLCTHAHEILRSHWPRIGRAWSWQVRPACWLVGQTGPIKGLGDGRSGTWVKKGPIRISMSRLAFRDRRAEAWEWLQVLRGTLSAVNQQTQRV